MNIAVIGAGSWGTALAEVAARNSHQVTLWARREELASAINQNHKNPDYLSDYELSSLISATTDLALALEESQAALIVVPSKLLRATAKQVARLSLSTEMPFLICSKGVEGDSGFVPVEIFADEIGNAARLACLSGPNHAEEVIEGIPSGTVIASESEQTASLFQEVLGSSCFRVYTSSDTLGVELCAAAKNVIAIAVGLSYGLGFGDNTAAMLMTRGQAEMSRLVTACGGEAYTCMGLAGTGDLIATCTSRHSRNRAFGEALAKGESLDAYEARRHMVVEGAQACKSLLSLAQTQGVELPIVSGVEAIIWQGASPDEISKSLALRSFKPEFY